MKRKVILIIVFASISLTTFAQLKVDQAGHIGMGTNWPSPGYMCHIAGNLLLTSYPSNPFYELRMKVNNGWPGVEIGSSCDKIAFWSTGYDFNDVYASNFIKMSDVRFKSNIINIKSGLNKLMEIRPVYYTIIENKLDSTGSIIEIEKRQYGFISQEIEKTLPEVNITEDIKDCKLMDYDQIIPLAVAAIQEQQKIIDSLIIELYKIKEKLSIYNSFDQSSYSKNNEINQNILYQNNPNPFNQKTEISFDINKQNFKNASIIIFDLNGTFIKSFDILQAGQGKLEINAFELKAGMYVYTLMVNNRDVDTKRMILLN